MKNNDAQLVQRVLSGDDTAFSVLVRKYQKSVHALVWRKIGDFHIAEDITQDTFLQAYQKLSTLKKPQRFASWLYVIAANYCKMWLRKKHLPTPPLENISSAQLEKEAYSGYVIAENKRTTAEAQREVVKKLLAKLQESDRAVITLYKRPSPFKFCADGTDELIPRSILISEPARGSRGSGSIAEEYRWREVWTLEYLPSHHDSDATTLIKIDWVFIGTFMSFFVILFTFDAVAGERTHGTLSLMMSN